MVDVEELERVDRVLLGGPAVGARGLKTGVAEQLGDDHQVGAPAHEPCREGVAQDVRGDLVVLEARGLRDRSDDVVRALDREAGAALVEKQCRAVGAGPVGAFVDPVAEGGAQVGVDRDLADLLALAENPQDPLARGQADVVDVEADDLGDPGAGVERYERYGAITRRRALLDLAQEPDCRARVQRLGGGPWELGARGVGGPEAAADVEVVDGGEGVVDGRGLALEDGLQMGAVVADRPITRVACSQRVAFGVGVGEPREVLADLRGVRAARLLGQRCGPQRRRVLVEDVGEGPRQGNGAAAAPRRRGRARVL